MHHKDIRTSYMALTASLTAHSLANFTVKINISNFSLGLDKKKKEYIKCKLIYKHKPYQVHCLKY